MGAEGLESPDERAETLTACPMRSRAPEKPCETEREKQKYPAFSLFPPLQSPACISDWLNPDCRHLSQQSGQGKREEWVRGKTDQGHNQPLPARTDCVLLL